MASILTFSNTDALLLKHITGNYTSLPTVTQDDIVIYMLENKKEMQEDALIKAFNNNEYAVKQSIDDLIDKQILNKFDGSNGSVLKLDTTKIINKTNNSLIYPSKIPSFKNNG